MKIQRRRLLSLVFTIILCLLVCPVISHAEEGLEDEVFLSGEDTNKGNASSIPAEGSKDDDEPNEDGEGMTEDSVEGYTEVGDGSQDPVSPEGTDTEINGSQKSTESEVGSGDAETSNNSGKDIQESGTEDKGSADISAVAEGEVSEAGTENGQSPIVAKDPYHNHQYVAVITEPTCKEKGYTTYTCSCGDSYVDDYTDALNHPEVIDVSEVPATAESSGTTAGKKCAVCGEILEGCEEIPALTEIIREFDKSVITGFEVSEPEEIREEVKPILDELMEELPSEITIFFGGTLSYEADKTDKAGDSDDDVRLENADESEKADGDGEASIGKPEGAEKKTVPVIWTCRQDYDEDLPVFEFVPELEDYELAPGVSLPVQRVYIESEVDGPVGGHIPSGTGGDVPFAVNNRKGVPSASFNAYTSGWLPPVRNQGSEGACWSFAAIGSIEADLVRGGWNRDSIDLSELYLAYYATHKYPDSKGGNTGDKTEYTGSGRYLSNGGNNYMSYRTMANMVGPVAETTAPYPNGDPNGPNVAQMTGAYLYNPEDRAGIKAAILAHGGVDAAMYWTGACYSSTYNSYYYPYHNANHEIMLVGWDDSFPASNFRSDYQPGKGQDGAWLVRNSWGKQGYGYEGYFWMSYYDGGLLSDVVTAYDAEEPRYESCYAYDSLPFPNTTFYLSRGKEVSQSFTLQGAEIIRAVGFETGGNNVTATVTVSNGQSVSSGQVYVGNRGFYIAELNTPLTGASGQEVKVTLSFNGDSSILYEDKGASYCGDTYYTSYCGGGGFVVDNWTYQYDARIKLYTDADSSGGQVPIDSISLSQTMLNLLIGDHEQLYVRLAPENASGALSWTTSNAGVARVDQGLVMAVAAGTADITVTSSNGKSAVCQVTVSPISVRGITIQGFTNNPKVSEISDTNENSGFVIPNQYPIVMTFRTNPLNATNQNVTWKSSNPSIAFVTTETELGTNRKEAHVFLKDAGTAVVTVTSADGNHSDSVTFKITKTMCTLKYDANGGSGAPAQQRISKGGTLNLQSGKPTRSGYTFKGWATSKSAATAQYQPGASFKASGNTTFYAVWAKNQPDVSVFYRTHVQDVGWQGYVSNGTVSGTSGRSLRLEAINIYLSGNSNLGVQYTTHCQDYGWLGWSVNGEMNGTSGESKRLEAIKILLTGSEKDKYDICYRVHAENIGWMGWAKNGAAAGTSGYAYRLEAIQILVLKKGSSFDTGIGGIISKTNQAYISKGGSPEPGSVNTNLPKLSYRTHVQDEGWQSWRTNGEFAGTSGRCLRLEGINIELTNKNYSGGIRYRTHVQDIGWQDWSYDGAMAGTSGRALRLEAINIELYGDMAQYYDIYYRVHAQDVGWMGWAKNGLSSGTAGYARRLEGIQIVIVKKGAQAPGNTYNGISQNDSRPYISRTGQ